VIAGLRAVIPCALSARLTNDSRAQFYEIGPLPGSLDRDVLALLDQEAHPLRDGCDVRSDLTGLSRIAMEAPQHS